MYLYFHGNLYLNLQERKENACKNEALENFERGKKSTEGSEIENVRRKYLHKCVANWLPFDTRFDRCYSLVSPKSHVRYARVQGLVFPPARRNMRSQSVSSHFYLFLRVCFVITYRIVYECKYRLQFFSLHDPDLYIRQLKSFTHTDPRQVILRLRFVFSVMLQEGIYIYKIEVSVMSAIQPLLNIGFAHNRRASYLTRLAFLSSRTLQSVQYT